MDLAPAASHEAVALRYLDEAELARVGRYRRAGPRRQFVLCRAALRVLLCARIGCRNDSLSFAASRVGKPRAVVDGRPVATDFSVSHSGEHGLIALSRAGRVGVDVEERTMRHDIDGPLKTVFAPAERLALAAVSGEAKARLFFKLWTCKEALIKALGTGFTIETSEFELPGPMLAGAKSGLFRFPDLPEVDWRVDMVGNARFEAATARELPKHGQSGEPPSGSAATVAAR